MRVAALAIAVPVAALLVPTAKTWPARAAIVERMRQVGARSAIAVAAQVPLLAKEIARNAVTAPTNMVYAAPSA